MPLLGLVTRRLKVGDVYLDCIFVLFSDNLFIQRNNIEIIACLVTEKEASDEHVYRVSKRSKIPKKIISRGKGWLEKIFFTMKYIIVEEVKTKRCLRL